MRKLNETNRHTRLTGGIATIVLGAFLMTFPFRAEAQYEDYEGPEYCAQCHEENYNDWKVSGHPYKLMKSEMARNRPIPLPEGLTWDDVTYVIGGYKWKSRYLDDEGYIYTPADGKNQYNNLTGEWSDYHAGEVKPYNCGACHTTAWIADEDADTDGDLSDNQDGLPGIHGTFFAGGIQCEECHGPGFDSMEIDDSAAACGECHVRGDIDTIPASGGFIRHHEQYNEHLAGPHASRDCVDCHNPHKKSEFSIVTECETCHGGVADSYAKTSMYDYGVECEDCHMPFATKSAQALGPNQGDVKTHIFYINTDPTASMFTEDGGFVALDADGKGAVTMDFACQRCHETASLDELALYAKDFHDEDKGLEDIGIDVGLTGTWWNADRSGEGVLLEVGYINGALFMFASFYTYGPDGEQVWLTAQLDSADGTTANVSVFMPAGGQWGDDFDSANVTATPWGSGTFTFPTCGSGSFDITPNQAMADMGFTNLAYNLTRTLEPGIACPTFVNNEMAAAQ
jgi:hypothetical protein